MVTNKSSASDEVSDRVELHWKCVFTLRRWVVTMGENFWNRMALTCHCSYICRCYCCVCCATGLVSNYIPTDFRSVTDRPYYGFHIRHTCRLSVGPTLLSTTCPVWLKVGYEASSSSRRSDTNRLIWRSSALLLIHEITRNYCEQGPKSVSAIVLSDVDCTVAHKLLFEILVIYQHMRRSAVCELSVKKIRNQHSISWPRFPL